MKNEGNFTLQGADGFPFSPESEDFKKGVALMRKVLGPDDAAQIEQLIGNPMFGSELGYLFSKTWGALYARENLPLRERAMLLMGTDLALGREGPLKDHMRVRGRTRSSRHCSRRCSTSGLPGWCSASRLRARCSRHTWRRRRTGHRFHK